MTEKPKRVMRMGIVGVFAIIIGAALMCVGSVVGFAFLMIRVTQPPADASRAFLEALRDEDYALAYDLLDPASQREYENADALAVQMENSDFYPAVVGTFGSRNVENDTARVIGDLVMRDDSTGEITVWLRYDHDEARWRVESFQFR